MNRVNTLIRRWSSGWKGLLAVVVATALSLQLLFVIDTWFARATARYSTFDLQTPLSLADVREQLPAYTPESRAIYWVFVVADTFFPLFGSLISALLLARVLRYLQSRWSRQALDGGWALLPLLPAVMDWIENLLFLLTIYGYPRNIAVFATSAIALKYCKVALGAVTNAAILGLTLSALGRRLAAGRSQTQAS